MKIVLEYNVFYISVISTILIVLLLAVRGLFGSKIHRAFFTVAWMAVLVRLIVPLGIVLPVVRPGWVEAAYDFIETVPFLELIWVWGTGACVVAAVFAVRYVICGRMLREALPIQNVPDIDEEMFTFMGIRVYVSDRISSPVTFGIFRQKVLLPKYYMKLSREQLKFILIHEKIHIDGHDNLNKFLILVAVCIHWFNPFAWLMYVCSNRDLEMACDEKVIRQVGEPGREAYANVLIGLASRDVMIGEPAYSRFAGNSIRRRIVMIMGYRGVRRWNYALYVPIFLLLLFAFSIPKPMSASSGPAPDMGSRLVRVPEVAPDEEGYEAVRAERVLKMDVSGARAHVTARTKEGVEMNFKLLMNKGVAVTNSGVLTSYLPEGRNWVAGIDPHYAGSVTIPEAVVYEGRQYPVKKIGSRTFYECRRVTGIRVPDTVQEIETKAFYRCESLKEVRLPASLEVMGVNPFIGCRSLEAFDMPESRAQYQVKGGVLYTDFGRFLKVYPPGRKAETAVVPDEVEQIATCAFYGAKMRTVTLPRSMIRVKSRSFQNCSQLTEVNASEGTRFARDAFVGADGAAVKRYG